ncbi:MAG: acetate kinase [Phycisphaerae bacterium]
MKVFVVNCGSSSIKYQLFSMAHENVLAKGVMERVGSDDAKFSHSNGEQDFDRQVEAPDHSAGMRIIIDALVDEEMGVLDSIDEIQAVGHRVVHGGEDIHEAALCEDEVLEAIRKNFLLSPLHNPANLEGIQAAQKALPDKPQVAVFDTAFFGALPAHAYRYAVPEEWYTEHGVRRYGFHGTSHRYVTRATARILDKPESEVDLITCHLGNGCSMSAIRGGKPVDHSMGMTPLEGLVMGTRSGDIDPAIITFMTHQGKDIDEVDTALNKQSGLLGVSQRSNDMRDLLNAVEEGDKKAELAVDMFVYRLVKYIGAYYTILPKVDAVVLTGGIGENSTKVREKLTRKLARLGAEYDHERNQTTVKGEQGPITADDCRLPVLIVPTNEELMIARDTAEVVQKTAKA